MTIATGETLPDATLKLITPEGTKDVTTAEYFGGRKIVMFGVPGAFTPTCSKNHLPGFLENRDAILARGVDAIAVLAVNDHFVMKAWAEQSGSAGKIDSLSDGNATFVKAMGLDIGRQRRRHGHALQALLDDRRGRRGQAAQSRNPARPGDRFRRRPHSRTALSERRAAPRWPPCPTPRQAAPSWASA